MGVGEHRGLRRCHRQQMQTIAAEILLRREAPGLSSDMVSTSDVLTPSVTPTRKAR